MDDDQMLREAQKREKAAQESHNLNTPRFKEAFKRTGLTPADLKIKGFQEFAANGQDRATQRMKFHHYEKSRQQALTNLLKKKFLKKIFGYEARCEFWAKIGLRFWILVG